MLDVVVTTGLQYVEEAMQITLEVGMRVRQRIPNTGLGSKVDNKIQWMRIKQFIQPLSIDQIDLMKSEIWNLLKLGKPGLFEPDIIVIIQIVDSHYCVSQTTQFFGEMKANKASGTGN